MIFPVRDDGKFAVPFRIVFEKLPGAAKIRFGCRKRPVRVLLNGGETEFRYGKDGRLQTAPGASGTLEILFA